MGASTSPALVRSSSLMVRKSRREPVAELRSATAWPSSLPFRALLNMTEYDVDTSLIDEERTLDLPYDDAAAEAMGPTLASRIQPQKVYLLEESAAALHARLGKVTTSPNFSARVLTCYCAAQACGRRRGRRGHGRRNGRRYVRASRLNGSSSSSWHACRYYTSSQRAFYHRFAYF